MKTHEKTIVLHTYPDMYEAAIMQELLNESGIDSFLNDENVMGVDPVGGTELRIFEKDKEIAESILTAKNSSKSAKDK
ncbi:MAG TPA: DUF2007 domain-containing protein [Chitinophagaceae bacterium]|jgi:hypothetical protein|nr:DUF2007 domain-containing protein [Chitinophagaceae bacterium]HMU56637.1 DUF2007 domain-containing protein [Chitinophagaceae bacterium]